jgi:hypothetical protein
MSVRFEFSRAAIAVIIFVVLAIGVTTVLSFSNSTLPDS